MQIHIKRELEIRSQSTSELHPFKPTHCRDGRVEQPRLSWSISRYSALTGWIPRPGFRLVATKCSERGTLKSHPCLGPQDLQRKLLRLVLRRSLDSDWSGNDMNPPFANIQNVVLLHNGSIDFKACYFFTG